MTDDDVISEFVQRVPGAIKNKMVTKLADELRPIFRDLINYERQRCSNIAKGIRQEASGVAKRASAQNDQKMMVAADSAARAAHGISGLIMQAPGECSTCNGAREVASTLAPGCMVKCPDCKPAAPAQAPEAVA